MGCSCGKHVFLAHVFFGGAWAGVCEIVGCDVVIKDLQGAGPLAGSETCASGFCPRCGRAWDLMGSSGGLGVWRLFFFGVGKGAECCGGCMSCWWFGRWGMCSLRSLLALIYTAAGVYE
jgi:hypothetical protein